MCTRTHGWRLLSIVLMLGLLTNCGMPSEERAMVGNIPVSTAATEPATSLSTTAISLATGTARAPIVSATPTPTTDVLALTAELSRTIVAQLPPTPTASSEGESTGIDNVRVLPLQPITASQSLWAVVSIGLRNGPRSPHFVAIYTSTEAGWHELSRITLPEPDQINPQDIAQVDVVGERRWVAIRGLAAIGPCSYDLISFDGTTLRNELSRAERYFEPRLDDLDRDGTLEVILERWPYQGAAGHPKPDVQVFRWEGTRMEQVQLTPMADSDANPARRMINKPITLARGGLWKDAAAAISELAPATLADVRAKWNTILITQNANVLSGYVTSSKDQALARQILAMVFYGDYPAVLDLL